MQIIQIKIDAYTLQLLLFFFCATGYTSVWTPEHYETTSIYNHVKKECVCGDQA